MNEEWTSGKEPTLEHISKIKSHKIAFWSRMDIALQRLWFLPASHIFWYTQGKCGLEVDTRTCCLLQHNNHMHRHWNGSTIKNWRLAHLHLVKNCDFYCCKCLMEKSCNNSILVVFCFCAFCVTRMSEWFILHQRHVYGSQCFCLDHSPNDAKNEQKWKDKQITAS